MPGWERLRRVKTPLPSDNPTQLVLACRGGAPYGKSDRRMLWMLPNLCLSLCLGDKTLVGSSAPPLSQNAGRKVLRDRRAARCRGCAPGRPLHLASNTRPCRHAALSRAAQRRRYFPYVLPARPKARVGPVAKRCRSPAGSKPNKMASTFYRARLTAALATSSRPSVSPCRPTFAKSPGPSRPVHSTNPEM